MGQEQKFTIKEHVIGCGIVIVIVMLVIISAGNWLWDVSGGKEWYTHHQEQKKSGTTNIRSLRRRH